MAKILIEGNKRLSGEIKLQGAKNSVLPVLAATILCGGECEIHNCPNLSDVNTSLKILSHLGCFCIKDGSVVTVNSNEINAFEIPDSLMREMRSSIVFLGAIVAKMGRAVISNPGGCELGPRPIDLHLSSLEKLGVQIKEDHGFLYCETPNGLKGTEIHLSFPSVGATENIILAAALAEGTTIIHNAAKEPEVSDLADFLNSAGAKIYGCGSDTIEIRGVKSLCGVKHSIIPDRIAAVTYMAAAAVTGGDIIINNAMPSHLMSVLSVFKEAGCNVTADAKSIRIKQDGQLLRVPTIRTLVYPAFPTDAGPIVIAMLSMAQGTTVFVENIFENRYKYTEELKRLGAKIKTEGKVAVVEGVKNLSAACCECTDLRGGAALVVAALATEGVTEISKIEHILRGYDDITGNINLLGGKAWIE